MKPKAVTVNRDADGRIAPTADQHLLHNLHSPFSPLDVTDEKKFRASIARCARLELAFRAELNGQMGQWPSVDLTNC